LKEEVKKFDFDDDVMRCSVVGIETSMLYKTLVSPKAANAENAFAAFIF